MEDSPLSTRPRHNVKKSHKAAVSFCRNNYFLIVSDLIRCAVHVILISNCLIFLPWFALNFLFPLAHFQTTMNDTFDCIVVGSGHAGSCAALSAIDAGCQKVVIVEKAPKEWSGGNGYFTAGAHRTTHGGLADLLPLVHNVSPEQAKKVDVEQYTAAQFADDINRLGGGQADRAMVEAVVAGSQEPVKWLKERVGVPFVLSFNRQAYEVDGRQKFWGGMALSVDDGGKGLIKAHQRALSNAGIEIWYDCPAREILAEYGRVRGLVVEKNGESVVFKSPAVVLACGGFEASAELRVKHLGSSWARARVRRTGSGLIKTTKHLVRFEEPRIILGMGSALQASLGPRSSGTGLAAIAPLGMLMLRKMLGIGR